MPRPARDGKAPTVVHLTAEYWPYARTGGLGEAVEGIARGQAQSSVRALALMPLYRVVRDAGFPLEPVGSPQTVALGGATESIRLWRPADRADGAPAVIFVDHPPSFDRGGIYGEAGADYPDNPRRFALFCRAALEALAQLARPPIVLHAHDWHTALAPVYLRQQLAGDRFYDQVASVLSVHNAGFQGHFPRESLPEVGLPDSLYDWQWLEWFGRVNWLKGGLAFTDFATTVSPTHAHELRTEVGGFGLHDAFIALKDRFIGILNGIDVDIWDPAVDPNITRTYTADDLTGKQRCKAALQRAYGLPQRARTPLLGMSARLVSQKGLDLILGAHFLWAADAQFVFLGQGEERYETALREIAAGVPDRVAVETNFTDEREHRLLAGADVLLMPSLYEPCGLTQMRAQRYGALPVGRRTGGLADTIEDEETGFLFDDYTPAALELAVRRALGLYEERGAWERHMRQAMGRDFSWSCSVTRYLEVYQRALSRCGRA
ncbi:MAG: glycogen synthase [Gemmatimonadetes bacterium]|nr:glycogen synthase [Gemmatimonadota bacterium]